MKIVFPGTGRILQMSRVAEFIARHENTGHFDVRVLLAGLPHAGNVLVSGNVFAG